MFNTYIRTFVEQLSDKKSVAAGKYGPTEESKQNTGNSKEDESYFKCLQVYSDFKLGKIDLFGNQSQIRLIESLLTRILCKVLWTLSNIFAENDMATKAMTLENVTLLCDLAQEVTLHMQGENYKEMMDEIFFALSNLITECDAEHLFKTLVAEDPE